MGDSAGVDSAVCGGGRTAAYAFPRVATTAGRGTSGAGALAKRGTALDRVVTGFVD